MAVKREAIIEPGQHCFAASIYTGHGGAADSGLVPSQLFERELGGNDFPVDENSGDAIGLATNFRTFRHYRDVVGGNAQSINFVMTGSSAFLTDIQTQLRVAKDQVASKGLARNEAY